MSIKTTIKAGGGIVINAEDQVLMIFRRSHWDLPKGKLEDGETIKQCALREVREECGIKNLTLKRFICTTEHEYTENGNDIIKESHWFEMSGSGDPAPQIEEDISIARWVSASELPILLKESYPTIVEVFKRFLLI